jgi:cytoskeletal protein RodZ
MRLSVTPIKRVAPRFGFKTSIIALFVAVVLVIGLTLVYVGFARITAVTDSPPANSSARSQQSKVGKRDKALDEAAAKGLEHREHEEGLEPHLSKGRQGSMTRSGNEFVPGFTRGAIWPGQWRAPQRS